MSPPRAYDAAGLGRGNARLGGRRPADLYWRIHSGIRGAGMPAMVANPGELAEKEGTLWDLVAFIQLLPYADKRAELRKTHGIFLD